MFVLSMHKELLSHIVILTGYFLVFYCLAYSAYFMSIALNFSAVI